jgi:hypothetical protein
MSSSDRAREGLDAYLASKLAPLDYFGNYAARVDAQNGDLTLELRPDTDRLPGLSKVPIRHGLPGVEVKVKTGARVMIGFDGGDPQRPYAMLFETSAHLLELVITAETKVTVKAPLIYLAGDGDARPVARQGDVVECILPPSMPLIGTIPAGPFEGVLTVVEPILGVIDTGSSRTFTE